jgi:hypothetical protein
MSNVSCHIEVGNTQQHENITDACGQEGFDHGCPGRGFPVPKADQQVRAQAHDLPTDEEGQHVIRNNQ